MKYEIYKAIDAIDGELSLFAFDEIDGFTVIDYSDEGLGRLIKRLKKAGCDWCDNPGESSRRNDMINPVLIATVEAE